MWKITTAGLSANLNPEHLERLLQALCSFSKDSDLIAMGSEFAGLAAHYREYGAKSCQDELSNAIALLSASLSASPDLPTLIVYDIHSLIGLIREGQAGPSAAIQHYLKALWIASSTEEIPREQLALTLHRLGRAYGRSGNSRQGKSLLAKAIQIYEVCNLHREPCMAEAKEMMQECELAIKASERAWSSLRGGFRRLSFIEEEQESSERRVSL